MIQTNKDFNGQLFEDIRDLCICCAKSVVVISQRYNEDPRLVSKLFIEAYKEINDAVENAK